MRGIADIFKELKPMRVDKREDRKVRTIGLLKNPERG